MFIAIEGCIGAGKTTTARLCAERLQYELLLERTEGHPFLNDFYADPSKHAIQTELGFVLIHYHQLNAVKSANHLIADFSPVKDLVYAQMNLSGTDSDLFKTVYDELTGRTAKPDVAIYLKVPVDELMRRIKERARAYEMYVPRSYIERLDATYARYINFLGRKVSVLEVPPNESRNNIVEQVLSLVHRLTHMD